jgi:small subunit ribosomal protein S2
VDTNCDPDEATYVIPGNDDAIRSCSLIARVIADGIEAGRQKVTAQELTRQAEKAEAAAEPEQAPEQAVAQTEAAAETALPTETETEIQPEPESAGAETAPEEVRS